MMLIYPNTHSTNINAKMLLITTESSSSSHYRLHQAPPFTKTKQSISCRWKQVWRAIFCCALLMGKGNSRVHMRKQLNCSRCFKLYCCPSLCFRPVFPNWDMRPGYLCTFILFIKKMFPFLLHLKACYIMSTVENEMSWINVDFSRTCMCIRSRIISVLVFNGSPLLPFSDEVSPRMDWLPRKRKRGRTNLQHDWLLSPPSPLFISTTISGIFINPHGSMCLGVVKIDKWLIRIPPFYFPTD